MKCQQLTSLLSFGALCFCVNFSAWVYVCCDSLSENIVKFNVANSFSLVDFCQFRNVSIDFIQYVTASIPNVKIIIFTTCLLFTVFSLLPASSRSLKYTVLISPTFCRSCSISNLINEIWAEFLYNDEKVRYKHQQRFYSYSITWLKCNLFDIAHHDPAIRFYSRRS